jgi:hypothetical protein
MAEKHRLVKGPSKLNKMTKAKQAINKDDSRGARVRKVNAERIKAGKPKRTTSGAAKKQDAKAGQMNRRIKGQQKNKPY